MSTFIKVVRLTGAAVSIVTGIIEGVDVLSEGTRKLAEHIDV